MWIGVYILVGWFLVSLLVVTSLGRFMKDLDQQQEDAWRDFYFNEKENR